jgi:hypothetical protein
VDGAAALGRRTADSGVTGGCAHGGWVSAAWKRRGLGRHNNVAGGAARARDSRDDVVRRHMGGGVARGWRGDGGEHGCRLGSDDAEEGAGTEARGSLRGST